MLNNCRNCPRAALAGVDLHLGVVARYLGRAFASNAQNVAVQGYVDLRRLQPWGEDVHLHAAGRASHVDRWQGARRDRADAARQAGYAERVVQFPAKALELTEQLFGSLKAPVGVLALSRTPAILLLAVTEMPWSAFRGQQCDRITSGWGIGLRSTRGAPGSSPRYESGRDRGRLCGEFDRLQRSLGRIPALEVAHVPAIENGTPDLQDCVSTVATPAHVAIALHPLSDHVVDHRLGPGRGNGKPSGVTLAIVHQHAAASSKVPDKAAEWVTNSAPANFAPHGFQPSQTRVSFSVPEQPLGTVDAMAELILRRGVHSSQASNSVTQMLEPHSDVIPVQDAFDPGRNPTRAIDVFSTVAEDRQRDIVPDPNRTKESLLAHPLGSDRIPP